MSMSFCTNPRRKVCTAATTIAISILLPVAGCASTGAARQFLTLANFEQLSVQTDGTRAWRDSKAGCYKAFSIDPSAITFGSDIQINEEQRIELQTALLSALTAKFGSSGLQIARTEQRGVLQVRGTVTAVGLANPALNTLTTLLLIGPLSRGVLAVELEAIDAESGKRVAALVFNGRAGLENLTSAYSTTGHATLQPNIVADRFV